MFFKNKKNITILILSAIILIIVSILIYIIVRYKNIEENIVGEEGINLNEFNVIEEGYTDTLQLKGIVGYTDENFDKVVSAVGEPKYEEDEYGNARVLYTEKIIGENNKRICNYCY